MDGLASSSKGAESQHVSLGLKLINQGTMWLTGGVAAGFLIATLSALVPQPQFAPPRTLAPALLAAGMFGIVGLSRWLIGAIHYAREVWKS